MKVKKLIEQLSEYPPDLEVYCCGDFDGRWKLESSCIGKEKSKQVVLLD